LEISKGRKEQGLVYTLPKEGTSSSLQLLQREVQSALFNNSYISLEAQINISKKSRAGHLLKLMCLPFHSHLFQLRVSQKLSQPWPKTGSRLSRSPSLCCSCRSAEALALGDTPIAFHEKRTAKL